MLPRFLALTAMAVLSSLALTETVLAQQLPWSRQGTYDHREVQRYEAPAFSTFPAPAAPGTETSRANYPSFEAEDRVRLNVTLPADARLMVQGTRTQQTGTLRRFESPALAPGEYTYE